MFNVDLTERWLILGKTGSGKTEFAKWMLRKVVAAGIAVVIVDVKEFWLGHYPVWETDKKQPGTIDKPHLVDRFNPQWMVQIIQPDVDESEMDERLPALCNDIIKKLLSGELQSLLIYFDESEGIATAHYVPRFMRKVWKTGRALGLGAWVATQAPKGIPVMFKSQAEKFISFKVGDEDAELAAEIVHATEEDVKDLKRFEYLFYDNTSDMDIAEWHKPLPEDELHG
jgi:energy-coupling factor transporter ATP-binding protein EcfA2